jgi:SAM-dependent methyltransferase
MSTPDPWKASLQVFFGDRAAELESEVSYEDLCYVSGREPRLWSEPGIYDDMIASIVELTSVSDDSFLLEVGCAAGFIARGLAPKVGRYVGIDLAPSALDVARRLKIRNASFRRADGGRLPFRNGSFDAALCYDVLTNFPRFSDAAPIVEDMIRVVRPGGRVLVGSIPDTSVQAQFEQRVKEVMADLDARRGPITTRPASVGKPTLLARLRRKLISAPPQILCYYFQREDFVALGAKLGCETRVCDIHSLNPYAGYRFNVVYTVPGS